MMSNDDMERRLIDRLDETATPLAPRGLAEAVSERVDRTRQLPSWATTERWISMETRAQFGAVPRVALVLASVVIILSIAASAIAVGASLTRTSLDAFGAAGNGLIAYVSGGQIYVVDPNGGEPRVVTSGPEVKGGPAWSRDGTRLAYWSAVAEGMPGTLWVTDAEGSEPLMIAQSQGSEFGGTEWSADGTEIMFDDIVPGLGLDPCPGFDGAACGSRLFVAKVDGTGTKPVGDDDLDARGPALSPDGRTIAFGGGEAASEGLYLMDWDGSDVRRLDTTDITAGGWAFAKQSWSTDGTQIATHSGGAQATYLVDADESDGLEAPQRLASGFWPMYAADGSGIAWAIGSGLMIWSTIESASAGVAFDVGEVIWSPDSAQFVGVRSGQLVVFDRLAEQFAEIGPADDANPSWQRVAP